MSNNASRNLVVLGFGGHARSVADVAMACGFSEILFVDANAMPGEDFCGYSVVREIPKELSGDWSFFPGAGNNESRRALLLLAQSAGYKIPSIVSPSATVGAGATISTGCFVGHHAHIGPRTRLGLGCLINTGAVVEHDCTVGDYAHISVNATVAGGCKLGSCCFIGAGATVIDRIQITDNVQLGAGGVIVRAITTAGVYAGVPAKFLRHSQGPCNPEDILTL